MLAKQNRLRLKKDFDSLLKSRDKFYSYNFVLRFRKNEECFSRFAFVVSKKVSKKAVDRNLIRRRASEIIRLELPNIKPGYNIAFFAKPGALSLDYQKTGEEIFFLLNKSRLFI